MRNWDLRAKWEPATECNSKSCTYRELEQKKGVTNNNNKYQRPENESRNLRHKKINGMKRNGQQNNNCFNSGSLGHIYPANDCIFSSFTNQKLESVYTLPEYVQCACVCWGWPGSNYPQILFYLYLWHLFSFFMHTHSTIPNECYGIVYFKAWQ